MNVLGFKLLDVGTDRVSLRRRVFEAGAWNFTGFGLSQVIRLGSNLILTRLLVPDMFGIMAIATIVMVGLGLFSDLGVRPIIIQSKRGNDSVFLNTAWTVQVIRGLLLWLIGVGISFIPAVANKIGMVPPDSVYADPRLPYVIAAVSFSYIVIGLNSTKAHESYRYLTVGRVTILDISAQATSVICMLVWSIFDRSISVLIVGYLSGSLVTMVLSHAWLSGTPNRLMLDRSALHDIFRFGKWIFLSSFFTFFVNNSDRLILGSLINSTTLGVYVIAFTIVSVSQGVMMRIIGGVMFPALSEIVRERPKALKVTYYKMHLSTAALAYFCSGVLMVSGQSLIALLYDPRYAQAGWMLEILAAGVLAVPFQIAVQCFMALGLPNIQSHIAGIRLASLWLAMPLGFHLYGFSGAICGIVISQLISVPIIIFYSIRNDFFDLKRELLPVPMFPVGLAIGALLVFAIGRYHVG